MHQRNSEGLPTMPRRIYIFDCQHKRANRNRREITRRLAESLHASYLVRVIHPQPQLKIVKACQTYHRRCWLKTWKRMVLDKDILGDDSLREFSWHLIGSCSQDGGAGCEKMKGVGTDMWRGARGF